MDASVYSSHSHLLEAASLLVSFFAVLQSDEHLAVDRLDIHLSCLPALGGRRNFVCDLGVAFAFRPPPKLRGAESERKVLKLYLPFTFRTKDIEDLGPHLEDAGLASLVFGAQCDIHEEDPQPTSESHDVEHPSQATVPETELESSPPPDITHVIRFSESGPGANDRQRALALNYVDQDNCRRTDASTRLLSRLDLGVAKRVKPGVTYYVRFRLPILGFGRAWTSQRMVPFLIPATATLDFRVADVREAAVPLGQAIEGPIAPIGRVNIDVATSIHYRFVRASPEPTNARLLENTRWFHYMGRRVTFMGRGKLVVTGWSHESVSTSDPMRIYASIRRDTQLIRLLEWLRVAIVGIIGVLLVFESEYWSDSALIQVVSALGDVYNLLPGQWILPSGLVGIIGLLVVVAEQFPKLRSMLSRIDRWCYNVGQR